MYVKYFFKYIVLSIILSYTYIDLSFDLLFTVLLAMAIVVIAIASLVLIVIAAIKRRIYYFVSAMSLMLSVVTTATITRNIIPQMQEKTKKKAEYIIQKLKSYKVEHGEYPDEIRRQLELEESDMKSEMGVFIERNFRYNKYDDEYAIHFDMPAWVQNSYNSKDKEWLSHD